MVPEEGIPLRDGKVLNFQGKITWSLPRVTRVWDLGALEKRLDMRKCLSFKEIFLGR
jgi:hypothetical protein